MLSLQSRFVMLELGLNLSLDADILELMKKVSIVLRSLGLPVYFSLSVRVCYLLGSLPAYYYWMILSIIGFLKPMKSPPLMPPFSPGGGLA